MCCVSGRVLGSNHLMTIESCNLALFDPCINMKSVVSTSNICSQRSVWIGPTYFSTLMQLIQSIMFWDMQHANAGQGIKKTFVLDDFKIFVCLGLQSTSGLGLTNNKTNQELNQSPTHHPALPNCIAVNSCMICPTSNIPNFGHDSKFTRPLSRAGTRASSVKGEPGSALESNASASVKEKNVCSPEIVQGSGNMVAKVNRLFRVQGIFWPS